MATNQSPLKDLNRAHSVLNSCNKEHQLDAALSFFELVIQKWERLLSTDSTRALRSEFLSSWTTKKRELKLD